MAYNKDEIIKKSLQVIKKYKLIRLNEIHPLIGVSCRYYELQGLNKHPDILEALTKNKIDNKIEIRKKWRVSNNFNAQLTLYKLSLDPNDIEYKLLTTSFQNTTNEEIKKSSTREELEAKLKELKKGNDKRTNRRRNRDS